MRKNIVFVIALWLFSAALMAQTATQPEGDGTENNPYKIATWENLNWLSENSDAWDKYFEQTSNIEFPADIEDWNSGIGFRPIGINTPFTGTYNGSSFTISNLFVKRMYDNYTGLFGMIEDARISNLGIVNSTIKGGTITGGLVGRSTNSTVNSCFFDGTVEAENHSTGGLIGQTIDGEISKSYSKGSVTGKRSVGGFIGDAASASVTNSYSQSAVTGTENIIGGLIGNTNSKVINCYATGDVKGYNDAGGLVGYLEAYGEIIDCYAEGNVNGEEDNVGGLAGKTAGYSLISKSYSTGNVVNLNQNTGGLVGYNEATIEKCYSRSRVESQSDFLSSRAGGLIGYNRGNVNNSYSTGEVTGRPTIGGLIAYRERGDVNNSVWDTETSNLTQSDAGTGLTTDEMKTEATYTALDWDFDNTWEISSSVNDGYPALIKPEVKPDAIKPDGDGSESNPYQIATWQNLYWMSQQKNNFQEWGKNYIQTADIDFGNADPAINTWNGGKGWEPIGFYAMPNPNVNFYGTYNGQGYTIKNLYINASETNAALFAYTENATIVNLGLVDVDISGAIGGVAALVSNSNNTTIEKCYSTGNITNLGDWTAGGLVAHNGGTIKNSYSTASVIGKDWTGGFVGNNSSGTIENCYSTGSVNSSGSEGIGGFVGNNTYYDNEGTVVNSYWDKQTSDVPESGGDEQGTTTAEMKQKSTFANWNFDNVWAIVTSTNSGYPHLQFAEPTNETPEAIMPEGIGSEESPFLIAIWQNLYWLSQNPDYWYNSDMNRKYYFEQTADIDFAEATPAIETWGMGRGWLPIGKEKEFDLDHDSKSFKSVYDGKGYSIKNLYINRPMQDNIGLFGYTAYAIIKNINLENANIIGKDNVGAIVGKQTGAIIHPAFLGLHNSYANGTITGGENVGGLVGSNEDGYIEKSYSSVTVNGNWKVGGLVGNNTRKTGSTVTNSLIVDCYSTGNVVSTGTSLVGGLVGSNYKSEIKNSYSIGSISAPEQQQGYSYTVGGFVGSNYDGTITNCYWNTQTSGFTTSDGGEGKTTADMKMQNTYSEWDFTSVWQFSVSINNGYPTFINFVPKGNGTEENPYLIATWHNLKWISDNNKEWDKNYLQTANIEFPDVIMDWDNGKGWSPIGKGSNSFFTGVYNGQNYSISNLYINRENDGYIGLFGNVSGSYAKLININIVDADITGGSYVGALAGYIYWTSVENCHSSGNIKGSSFVGGLVGSYTWTAKMIKCSSSANVDGHSRVGGLVGFVGGNGGIGGIENCFSSGVVKGTEFVGGFAGEGSGARIFASHSTGDVKEETIGGYSGKGGFIGRAEGGTIKKCYSTGSVISSLDENENESSNTGGFVGTLLSSGTIENSYAMGNAIGCNNVGGFVGEVSNSQIKYSYSIGSATANVSNAAGFAAVIDGGTITACFWDTETSGLTDSEGGEGKTTAEMKESSTYTDAGWDFENIWGVSATENNGYPTFSVKHTLTITIVGDGVVNVNDEDYTAEISVDPGTTLNLEAIVNNGWQFEGWSGDLSITNATTTTITMDGNKSVTATFLEETPAEYTVTFTVTYGTNPIEGVAILVNSQNITTNATGNATIELPNGNYNYTVTIDNYETQNGAVVVNGADITENIELVYLSSNLHTLKSFAIYPNPFSSGVTINNALHLKLIEIVNAVGQRVLQVHVNGAPTVTIPTQQLEPGVYLIRLKTAEGKTFTNRVVKQ